MASKTSTIVSLLLLLLIPVAHAAEEDAGVEADKVISLASCAIALVLAALTGVAYTRTQNRRLLFVTAAFLLFALKTFLIGAEVFFGEWTWVDPVTAFMDFGILGMFFLGVLQKRGK